MRQHRIPLLQLRTHHCAYRAVDMPALVEPSGASLESYPYAIRVLLENLCRHYVVGGGTSVSADEVHALLNWPASVGVELPLHVGRVILPDSSGVPVLQDLAALRSAIARRGLDPASVDVHVPLDLVVDHSLQVDFWGQPDALVRNLRREFERNHERYAFIKWAQQAFKGLRVFPPGSGIIHQVNLEQIAQVVMVRHHGDELWAFPDFVIGGDSHTPMVNAAGVLGWGVGGIDAETALLGHAYSFPVPEVVGVRLHGRPDPHAYSTDIALRITEVLRAAGVVNAIVEFFGPAVASLTVAQRATLANMAPEYGATSGFFPVDSRTLEFLRMTGRSSAQIELVEAYCRRVGLWRADDAPATRYSRVIDIDLSDVRLSLSGPRRPQDRVELPMVAAGFRRLLHAPLDEGGFGVTPADGPAGVAPANGKQPPMPRHGAVVIAAITSCTNTSNPQVMLAAGIVARKALARGITPPWWVKCSLAPGSRAVTRYLRAAGLLEPLAALGFELVGYGCTTCGGKSGPLDSQVASAIEQGQSVAVAVLSGNRNFEGRIHKLVRANYIGAPPLVVLYALAGRIDLDLTSEPLGMDSHGQPVFMHELLPEPDELQATMVHAASPAMYAGEKNDFEAGAQAWSEVQGTEGALFPWDPRSHYLVEPPFFDGEQAAGGIERLSRSLSRARAIAVFGDSLTTDHISPGGEIPVDTPAGQYLQAQGIPPREFNTYVARRGNHHVMVRATFANIRLRNLLVPQMEGGFTRHFPDGSVMTIFDACERYRREGVGIIVLAGKDYGCGSSRDWAAKGSRLLGVRAVIAESFERIHRANLVGMGVLPLAFLPGQGWCSLGLDGSEEFSFDGIAQALAAGTPITVHARHPRGSLKRFAVIAQVLTVAERRLMASGGVPGSMLMKFTLAAEA